MFVGTAGWSIPKSSVEHFPPEGSHLARYSKVLNAVEINSSFYREHLAKSYAGWAQVVPENFQFSVKLSKLFIHDCGLKPKVKELHSSLDNIQHLGDKLGVILVQLPGKMEFNLKDAERFYKILRKKYAGPVALEPRNPTWVKEDSQKLLLDFQISKVIADPERCPGGKRKILTAAGLKYYRLHGSPIIYKSEYSKTFIHKLAKEMMEERNVWCIFDNTAYGMGTKNALELSKKTWR